jgi:hypothetical protein
MYIYIHIHTHAYGPTFLRRPMYIYIYTHTYTHTHTHTSYANRNVGPYIYIYIYIYTHTHTHTHTNTYGPTFRTRPMCVYIYTHISEKTQEAELCCRKWEITKPFRRQTVSRLQWQCRKRNTKNVTEKNRKQRKVNTCTIYKHSSVIQLSWPA